MYGFASERSGPGTPFSAVPQYSSLLISQSYEQNRIRIYVQNDLALVLTLTDTKQGNHSSSNTAASYCGERPPLRASNPFEDTGHSDEAAGPYPYSYQQHQYSAHKYSPYQKGYQG
jgi:hypothetical protein